MDISQLKLGKKPPRRDPRTLSLSKYIAAMPAPPAECDWLSGISSWGAMLNTQLGDCTIAAVGHAIQVWTGVTGNVCTVSDAAILQAYERWAGYKPSDPGSDQGAVVIDILNRWRKEGFGDPGLTHTLPAYTAVDPGNREHARQAMLLFGGIYLGVELPVTAQRQIGSLWDVVGDPTSDPESQPGSWGGHAIFCPAYDQEGVVCITWGAPQKMTWAFCDAYVSEAYALLAGGTDWVLPGGDTILGFDLATLEQDLSAIAA